MDAIESKIGSQFEILETGNLDSATIIMNQTNGLRYFRSALPTRVRRYVHHLFDTTCELSAVSTKLRTLFVRLGLSM